MGVTINLSQGGGAAKSQHAVGSLHLHRANAGLVKRFLKISVGAAEWTGINTAPGGRKPLEGRPVVAVATCLLHFKGCIITMVRRAYNTA